MCSFETVVHCHVPNVTCEAIPAGSNGEQLIMLKNVNNRSIVDNPQPLYLLPEGTAVREGGPTALVVPCSCRIVYIDVIESEATHIHGKKALELVVCGHDGSDFRETACC